MWLSVDLSTSFLHEALKKMVSIQVRGKLSPPFTRMTTETVQTFYMKYGAREAVVRSRDVMTIKIDSHGYIFKFL